MKIIINITMCLFIFFEFSSPAFAYIDPGTGASFFAIISSFFIAIMAYIKIQWNNIKNFLKKLTENINKKNL